MLMVVVVEGPVIHHQQVTVVTILTRCLVTCSPQSRRLRMSCCGLILWSGQVLGKGCGCRSQTPSPSTACEHPPAQHC